MKKKLIISFLIIAIIIVFFIFWNNKQKNNAVNNVNNSTKIVEEEYAIQNDKIKIKNPKPKEIINSPITISGQAKGGWFFEGSFPVQIIDNTGVTVGSGVAKAEGEWMTDNFVPFSSTISFDQASTTHGFIIIKKDNPSGLPENDDSVQIPILFK